MIFKTTVTSMSTTSNNSTSPVTEFQKSKYLHMDETNNIIVNDIGNVGEKYEKVKQGYFISLTPRSFLTSRLIKLKLLEYINNNVDTKPDVNEIVEPDIKKVSVENFKPLRNLIIYMIKVVFYYNIDKHDEDDMTMYDIVNTYEPLNKHHVKTINKKLKSLYHKYRKSIVGYNKQQVYNNFSNILIYFMSYNKQTSVRKIYIHKDVRKVIVSILSSMKNVYNQRYVTDSIHPTKSSYKDSISFNYINNKPYFIYKYKINQLNDSSLKNQHTFECTFINNVISTDISEKSLINILLDSGLQIDTIINPDGYEEDMGEDSDDDRDTVVDSDDDIDDDVSDDDIDDEETERRRVLLNLNSTNNRKKYRVFVNISGDRKDKYISYPELFFPYTDKENYLKYRISKVNDTSVIASIKFRDPILTFYNVSIGDIIKITTPLGHTLNKKVI